MKNRGVARGSEGKPGPRTAVLYARVSSVEQQKDGFSIPSQQKLLRGHATDHDLDILREFTDVETARKAGRAAFGEMVAFLKANRKIRVILVEKTDRLYRNIKDWVTLDELDLEIHLVKENAILSSDSRSHEKLVHGFKVLMAKNYVDNLSEEVVKGMTEKAEQGHWPSWAPIGYLNDPETHRIKPEPVEGPIVAQLFEDAADPTMTLEKLSEAAYRRGLRSRRSKKRITREGIKRILANPIYWGPFEWAGRIYQGTHEPLITRALFDRVQEARRSTSKPRQRSLEFAFNGMASCSCGMRLTGQLVKGKYTYYGCSQRCGATPLLREKDLSARFLKHIEAIRVTEEVAEGLVEAIRDFEVKRRADREQTLARHHDRQRVIQRQLDSAYDDKLAGKITDDYWQRRSAAWQEELAVVRTEIDALESATMNSFDRADTIMKLCLKAPDLFVRQSYEKQARLIKLVCSNSVWDGVTLTAIYKKPFDQLVEGLQSTSGGADTPPYPNYPRLVPNCAEPEPEHSIMVEYLGMLAAA